MENSAEIVSQPTVAILGGTGKEGPGLALRWAYVGFQVIIGSRQKEKAQAVAAEINLELGNSQVIGMDNAAAARRADICVLTVVQSAHQAALASLRNDLQGKILVDATARVDFRDPQPPPAPSAGRLAQQILGDGVRVVAALQNVPSHALRKNLGGQLDTDVLVCADDLKAGEQVISLIAAIGMHGYYAGGLDNAVVVEGITALLISINKYYRTKTASIGVTGLGQVDQV